MVQRPSTAPPSPDWLAGSETVTPDSTEAVCETLAAAAHDRRAVVTRGNGTKIAWGHDPRADEGMYRRVYGKGLAELKAVYYEQSGTILGDRVEYSDLKAFTYWLFRYRLKCQDKARIASDTRKGLAQLTRMELAVSERRRGARLGEEEFLQRYG